MATFGAAGLGEAATSTGITSDDINVTGTDLGLVMWCSGETSGAPAFTLAWDPGGSDEAPTGTFAALTDVGNYIYSTLAYLDDPTAANAGVEVSATTTCDALMVGGAFCTNVAAFVGTDQANNSYTSGTTMGGTVPNVTTGDIAVDFIHYDPGGNPGTAATEGGSQTNRGDTTAVGNYSRGAISTRDGNGVMTWTVPTVRYAGTWMGARFPDSGGGGGPTIGDMNFQGTGRGVLRGAGRGVG